MERTPDREWFEMVDSVCSYVAYRKMNRLDDDRAALIGISRDARRFAAEFDQAMEAVKETLDSEATTFADSLERESPGDHLARLLFETTIDLNGNEHNSFADDLAFELRKRWRASYLRPAETGTDIEDSLGISGFQVNTICNLVADILRDWAVKGDS